MADPYPFAGKVIAITGASRGTGLALLRYLLVRGAKVSMAATSQKNLETALEGIKKYVPDVEQRVLIFAMDIGESEQVKNWIETTVKQFGKLDEAANVAGKYTHRV